jgi:hypothetical protein
LIFIVLAESKKKWKEEEEKKLLNALKGQKYKGQCKWKPIVELFPGL